jgi:hypothetical protein
MFSPSLFAKQQMEFLSDHSTKSLTEILRKQRHTKQHSDTCETDLSSATTIPSRDREIIQLLPFQSKRVFHMVFWPDR